MVKAIIFLILTIFIFPRSVNAYLDPGTGSYLIQIIVASVVGLSLFWKTALKKLKQIFTRHDSSSKGR